VKLSDALYKQAESPRDRMIRTEGGTSKVTRDTGGVTKGGIAESGGRFTAEQIKKLTPQQINEYWDNEHKALAPIKHPGTKDLFYHIQANSGWPAANRILQEETNRLLPPERRVKVDTQLGPATYDAVNSVPQASLAQSLMGRWKGRHEYLAANSARHAPYKGGWANRRKEVWNSPAAYELRPGFTGPPREAMWQSSLSPVKVRPAPGAPFATQPRLVKPAPGAPFHSVTK